MAAVLRNTVQPKTRHAENSRQVKKPTPFFFSRCNMADSGRRIRGANPYLLVMEAAISAKTVFQCPDGLAGIATISGTAGQTVPFERVGVFPVAKATGIVFLPGTRVYWDYSANAATFRKQGDRDFYLGTCVGGAASADTEVSVDFNVAPKTDIDLFRDGFASAPTGTQALGGFLPPQSLGTSFQFKLDATEEAQKVDALSVDSFANGANAIVEMIFRVEADGGAGTQDVSIGVANATHATDADSITEAVFVHLNGGDTNIYCESDDGTVEVAATDSTKDYTEGTALTDRQEVWLDMRDMASVKIYHNGVRVLSSTTFNVVAATGPWKLLVHLEKTATTDVYTLLVDRMTARFGDQ